MPPKQKRLKKPAQRKTPFEPVEYFTKIPPEIFINICKFLPPGDLFSLVRTCRLFYQYLASETSISTELIWRESRIVFYPWYTTPPPESMTERDYLRLIVEKGCQLCPERRAQEVAIRWNILVRCCSSCYSKHRATASKLKKHYNIPSTIIKSFKAPDQTYKYDNVQNNWTLYSIYWVPHVKKLYREYLGLNDNREKKELLANHKTQSLDIHTTARARRNNHHDEMLARERERREKKTTRRETISRRVGEMLKEKNEDGSERWDKDWIRNRSSVYRKALKSSSIYPFTDRAWITLRKKIEKEYADRNGSSEAYRSAGSDDEMIVIHCGKIYSFVDTLPPIS